MRHTMLCLCHNPPADPVSIIDVEKVIQDYAWQKLKETSNPWNRCFMRRRNFQIEVPMNYFHFEDIWQDVTKREKPKDKSVPKPAPKQATSVQMLSTHFRNDTGQEHTYKFRFERTQKATTTVTFQKGFSIGGKANFSLGLPKVVGEGTAGAEIDMRLQISKTTGETFEDSSTIETTSDIKVDKETDCKAEVTLSQRQVCADFVVHTMMTIPTGTAPVFIKNKRSGEIFATQFISDLEEVFKKYKPMVELVDVSKPTDKSYQYGVKFTTNGIIEGTQLSDHKVLLKSTKLDAETDSIALPIMPIPEVEDSEPTPTIDSSETQPLQIPILKTAGSSLESTPSPSSDATPSPTIQPSDLPSLSREPRVSAGTKTAPNTLHADSKQTRHS